MSIEQKKKKTRKVVKSNAIHSFAPQFQIPEVHVNIDSPARSTAYNDVALCLLLSQSAANQDLIWRQSR